MNNEDDIKILAKFIKDRGCYLFAGAGTSIGVGIVGWEELINELTKDMDYTVELDDVSKFLSFIEKYEGKIGRPDLQNRIRDILTIDQPDYSILSKIVSLGFDRIYTTNFDRHIENACTLNNIKNST